jgi:hypothetical protein
MSFGIVLLCRTRMDTLRSTPVQFARKFYRSYNKTMKAKMWWHQNIINPLRRVGLAT